MLRDNLVGSSRRWGAEVCSPRSSPNRHRIGRPLCLENPNPAPAEYSLTESATSPFHAEPEQDLFVAAGFSVGVFYLLKTVLTWQLGCRPAETFASIRVTLFPLAL